MPSSYPSGLDALQRVAAGDSMQSTSHSGLHNSQSDAIEAIQTVLGLSPQGGSATVGARCAALESGKASLSGSVSFGGTVGGTGLSGSLLSSASPVMNGTASAGTAVVPSRQDHVHPSDTSRAALSGATFTGDVALSKAGATATVDATGSTAAALLLQSAAGQRASLVLRTGSTNRWIVRKSSDAETGADAGSDLEIVRISDGGQWWAQTNALTITRSTGKITAGSVGASAGLEYGASGPRDMVGTGSPEGVVTAPVGSTWRDTNATTGAIRWIKASGTGNTGWRVEYGDTGVRNVAAGLLTGNGYTSVTSLTLRRVADTVTLYAVTLSRSGGTGSGDLAFYTLPSGFRPPDIIYQRSAVNNLLGFVLTTGDCLIRNPQTGEGLTWSWSTAQAWPTVLP